MKRQRAIRRCNNIKEYIKPELEVMNFDFADVIVISGDETPKLKGTYYASGDSQHDPSEPELFDLFLSK